MTNWKLQYEWVGIIDSRGQANYDLITFPTILFTHSTFAYLEYTLLREKLTCGSSNELFYQITVDLHKLLHIFCIYVTGNISWWHRFENDNLMILLAVIAGIILMVIIICIIIIIVCRRKRAADKCKYNSETCTEISLVETLYSCD